MIARTIVDVPAAQTDRLFDYLIPAHLEQIIQPGMRIIVPFGPRQIQGFVIEVTATSDVPKLKSVQEVLDPVPVLTSELLQLGRWLAHTTICFQISAFQVMLPAALKTSVMKELHLLVAHRELEMPLQPLFQQNKKVLWKDAVDHLGSQLGLVRKALDAGQLVVHYVVKEKAKKKMEKWVKVNKEADLTSIKSSAHKQLEIIHFIEQKAEPIRSQEVLTATQSTRAVLKSLIEKKLVLEWDQETYRDPLQGVRYKPSPPLPFTDEQQQAFIPLKKAIVDKRSETFLLHGVTGSGKTEIYLQAIDEVMKQGKEAIMLVPEISLTPQIVSRFKSRFGEEVAVMHSGLSVGEKYDEWRRIHRSEVKVVVGARSAVFAPFSNLGLIIMDEEHETSYKQEDMPRYHTKEVAIKRSVHHQCPVILGSATPSLETFARAQKGVYTLLSLKHRVNNRPMPTVDIVDMREELRAGNRSMFSVSLMEALKRRLELGEQSVLFLNRRGYSTFVMCRDCGYVPQCEHCDISLTYHRSNHSLKCHYCGHEETMPVECPECTSEHIRFFGSGTQKVEEELTRVLPEARVIRMDVDTTRTKGSHQRLLDAFGNGDADILLGTQMIAKGLDFPNITLVGVLAADTMLHIPDFRSAERTFQVLEQVSGRAGRHQRPGEVLLQSYTPEHYSIELVKSHDYDTFYQMEMRQRKAAEYPPYRYMALVTISDPDLPNVIQKAQKISDYLKSTLGSETVILGPVVSPIARIKDRYRYQCMIKYKNEPRLTEALQQILQHYLRDTTQGKLQISLDMHPYFFM
ncbi:primosomal protein N' [Alkalicoccobacillus murimartini]|uniref:Replication restart protein PriA n=1 Tax=Alkalicoccobacillus murimartini TaxID=171685 RepID=A0ABT9YFB2_9BACI|nr:primosomal protein N' [Alkalicoccobacillus murimartini]MDQ0206409.1 primosomal protein N' (replication factor Y) [Alkalicoccobacillus murimartini]